MFGIGGFELFIILIFGFLIFGPDKLPEIAKTVGKGIARFREAQQEVNEAIGDEKLIDLDNPDEPFKNPVEALDRLAKMQEDKKTAASKGEKPAETKTETTGEDDQGDSEPKQESFTERKARYERERAARKAAEAEAAKQPAIADDAATADAADVADAADAADAADVADAADATDAADTADAPAEGGDA